MWHTNKSVIYTYAHVNSKLGFAIFDGISGWKQIAPTSPDGVSNVLDILTVAQANNRKVNVYIPDDGMISAVYMLP